MNEQQKRCNEAMARLITVTITSMIALHSVEDSKEEKREIYKDAFDFMMRFPSILGANFTLRIGRILRSDLEGMIQSSKDADDLSNKIYCRVSDELGILLREISMKKKMRISCSNSSPRR